MKRYRFKIFKYDSYKYKINIIIYLMKKIYIE